MCGREPRASCRGLFRKLEILPVPCQYILSLMLFIIDNPNNFQTGFEIHGLHTWSKNQLFIPIANLTSVQKGIAYSGTKIYISLPSNILNLKNDKKQFKNDFMFMVPCIILYSMNNQQMQLYAVNFIPLLGSLYMFRVFYTPTASVPGHTGSK